MRSSLPTTMAGASRLALVSQESALQEVLVKARDAIRCGNAGVAVRSLSAFLGGDQHAFHHALLNLLDSSSGTMRQQLIDEARSQRADFALDAHNKEGKTALDLAVRHNDREFADYLLRHGANPERTSLVGTTPPMRALVTRWRLKTLLYADRGEAPQRLHAGADQEKWTSLDLALSQGSYQEANEMLQEKMGGNTLEHHAELWNTAIENKQHDVLRAILLLRLDAVRDMAAMNKQAAGKWLNALHQDSGLSAALKEFPYQSAKRGAPENLNGKAKFRGTAKFITCRHLSTFQQEEQALDPKIKFDYRKFGNRAAITNNVQPEIEKTYKMLQAQASATHLIDNRKFGQFLSAQFQEMEGGDLPATRMMLLESTNHTMNLVLMIKEKEGKKSYVVKFFDPNDTTTGTRRKASSAQTFEMPTIESYLSDEYCRAYYPEAKGLSIIFVRPQEERQTADTSLVSADGRRLTTCIDIRDVDATAVWHFMASGFAANLRDLQSHLGILPEAQRIELLAGKDAEGTPALFMAMQNGHAEAIKAYGELVRQAEPIPEQQLIALLAGKDAKGTSALFMAMQDGHAEAVKAYGELVGQAGPIPEQQLIALLAGKDAKGTPALFMAMQKGHAEAIKAYGEAVKSLPPDMQADLLLAKVSMGPFAGKSLFSIALKLTHFEAINAQLQLLVQLAPSLSEGKRAELRKELQDYEKLMAGNKIPMSRRDFQELRKMRDTLSQLKAELSND